jgi:YVTN family beta-propeller protein
MGFSRLPCAFLLLAGCAKAPAPTVAAPASEPQREPEQPEVSAAPGNEHVSPDHGTLVVLNKAEATASLIDLRSHEIVATVPTGVGPHEVAVSDTGNVAVVTNYGTRESPGHTLTVIDVGGGQAMHTIELTDFHRPHGIAFIDGERVLVTAEEEKAVVCVDIYAQGIPFTISTQQDVSHMVAITPDRQRAFVANIGSGTVTALDLVQGTVIRSLPTGAGAEGIDVTPDGRQVWVTNRDADTVTVIDASSLETLANLPSESFPIRAAATPSSEHVLVTNAGSGVVNVFDTASKTLLESIPIRLEVGDTQGRMFGDRFPDSSVPIGILVHPDGHEAYVAHANADVITILDLDNFEPIGTLTAGKEPDGLGYSDETVQLEGE